MEDRTGKKWTRDETILAFDLYWKIPFGRVHENNPDVIALANLIGRKPAAVKFKIGNLASYDPERIRMNKKGLQNASKLDEEIVKEFTNNLGELEYQAQMIKADIKHVQLSDIIDLGDIDAIPSGEYREREIKTRVGQHFFRNAILNVYGGKCCVTGWNNPELLVASHIKPWSVSDGKTERTNPSNGLCLNAFHDKAFDRGFITLDDDYRIVISSHLGDVEMDDTTRRWFYAYKGKQINLPEKFLP